MAVIASILFIVFFILDCAKIIKNRLLSGIIYISALPVIVSLFIPSIIADIPQSSESVFRFVGLDIILPITLLIPIYVIIIIGVAKRCKNPSADDSGKAAKCRRADTLGIIASCVSVAMCALCIFFAAKALVLGIEAGIELFGIPSVDNITRIILSLLIVSIFTFGLVLIIFAVVLVYWALTELGAMLICAMLSSVYGVIFCAIHIIAVIFGFAVLVRLRRGGLISTGRAVFYGILTVLPVTNLIVLIIMRKKCGELVG